MNENHFAKLAKKCCVSESTLYHLFQKELGQTPVNFLNSIKINNAIKYLEKKEYAVTKSVVELTKKLGKGAMSGFVNAFLRKFVKEKDSVKLPEKTEEYLSIKYSCLS